MAVKLTAVTPIRDGREQRTEPRGCSAFVQFAAPKKSQTSFGNITQAKCSAENWAVLSHFPCVLLGSLGWDGEREEQRTLLGHAASSFHQKRKKRKRKKKKKLFIYLLIWDTTERKALKNGVKWLSRNKHPAPENWVQPGSFLLSTLLYQQSHHTWHNRKKSRQNY